LLSKSGASRASPQEKRNALFPEPLRSAFEDERAELTAAIFDRLKKVMARRCFSGLSFSDNLQIKQVQQTFGFSRANKELLLTLLIKHLFDGKAHYLVIVDEIQQTL